MLPSSVVKLLVSLTALTRQVSALPVNEVVEASGQDDLNEKRALERQYTPLPNRPTAAHLPKRTLMGATKTQPPTAITAKAIHKRQTGIDAEQYLSVVQSLESAFAATTSDLQILEELSMWMSSFTAKDINTEAFRASFASIISGAGNGVGTFASAASAAASRIGGVFEGDSSDDTTSVSGVISTNGGTTYWSLPDYASTWAGMSGSVQDSWRSLNNYVGTFTDSPASTFAPGVMATAPGLTTWWESDAYLSTIASLSTIDNGFTQISWTKNNVWSRFDRTTSSVVTGTTAGMAGVSAQMFTLAGANPSSVISSVPSGNDAFTQGTTEGGSTLASSQVASSQVASSQVASSQVANSQVTTNVMAVDSAAQRTSLMSGFTTNESGVTSSVVANQQPTAGAASTFGPGNLASCPTITGVNGPYVACNKGGDPGLPVASTTSPISIPSTVPSEGQTSLATSAECTLAACIAMNEPYTSHGATSM